MNAFTHTLRAACLAAAACVLAACSTITPGGNLSSATFTMQPGDTVAVGPGDLPALRYERANDSRCPPGVQCIWAGTIIYEFTLLGAVANEQFALTPDRPRYDAVLDPRLHLMLGKFDPPPAPPEGGPKPVYQVTIMVERDN